MSYKSTPRSELGRSRPVLLILAVIAPSLALIVLSLRMLSQDATIAESRKADEHAQAIREFAQIAVLTADRYKNEAVSTEKLPEPVVFTAPIENGKLILPWQHVESTRGIDETDSSTFSSLISEAERFEFRSAALGRAIQAYRRALDVARDSLERAYALVYLSRSLEKAGEIEEARELRLQLVSYPPNHVDEFNIPFSFYAAQTLATDTVAVSGIISLLEQLQARRTLLSPEAAFLLLNVSESIGRIIDGSTQRGRFDSVAPYSHSVIEQANRAVQLQKEFDQVNALLNSAGETSESAWTIYGDDRWLVSMSNASELVPSRATVIDVELLTEEVASGMQLAERGYEPPVLTGMATPSSQWLGPLLPGVHLILTTTDEYDRIPGLGIRYAFILLAMLLVVGLAALGAYLWWRDTKREVQLAQERSDFVSSVSHELKTPLTSIRMFTETLRYRNPSEDARRKYQDTILSESARLTRLLNNVLDFSKIEKGTKRYDFEPVELQRVIEAALRMLAYPFQAKGYSIVTEFTKEDLLVSGDSDALEQVVLNLLSNALKFSRDRKEIIVRLRKKESEAILEVQDFGIGIDSEDRSKIFDRFFRARGVRNKGIPGTGLGLSIAQHAVEAHNGRIGVDSVMGEGSTFIIHLPLFESE